MSCPQPFDAVRIMTESLGETLYQLATPRSLPLNLIPREEYPIGTGLVQSVFTVGRSMPTTDTPAFTPITLTTGDEFTGACGNNFRDVSVGHDEDTYGPEKLEWQGPPICQEDLVYGWKAHEFWQKYLVQMAMNVDTDLSNRIFAGYDHYVTRAVANTDFHSVAGNTGAPPQAPDLTLDMSNCFVDFEMLEQVAAELNLTGASQPDKAGWISLGDAGPIYTLDIGQHASQQLLRTNAEIREDYRYASSGHLESSPLLKRMGATRVIGNFRHRINLTPPRYNYVGGEYIRVNTWEMVAGTKGTKANVRQEWLDAPYEGMRVLHPDVIHDQIIRPVTSLAGMKWPMQSTMGEWKFVVGGSKIALDCLDPLDNWGRHYAQFRHAMKPIFPDHGRLIIFRRCPSDAFPCTNCS